MSNQDESETTIRFPKPLLKEVQAAADRAGLTAEQWLREAALVMLARGSLR